MTESKESTLSIADVYDRLVADHYDDDTFGIIGGARAMGLAQLQRALGSANRIGDLGMGTGDGLLAIHRLFPNAELWGVDVSKKMIDRARAKFAREEQMLERVNLRHGDAVDTLVPPASLNAALSHFVLNYVDAERLGRQVARALEPGGLWSIATSTRDSFPELARLAHRFLPPESQPLLHTRVPEKPETICSLVSSLGFDVVERETQRHPIELTNFDALVRFTRHSGWFASDALARFSEEEIESLRPMLVELFPIHDAAHVTLLLCRKR